MIDKQRNMWRMKSAIWKTPIVIDVGHSGGLRWRLKRIWIVIGMGVWIVTMCKCIGPRILYNWMWAIKLGFLVGRLYNRCWYSLTTEPWKVLASTSFRPCPCNNLQYSSRLEVTCYKVHFNNFPSCIFFHCSISAGHCKIECLFFHEIYASQCV